MVSVVGPSLVSFWFDLGVTSQTRSRPIRGAGSEAPAPWGAEAVLETVRGTVSGGSGQSPGVQGAAKS